MRSRIAEVVSATALVILALALGLGALELAFRVGGGERYSLYNPCFIWGSPDGTVQDRYRSNCISNRPTLGRPIEYRFNSLGLRDPREPGLGSGAVLVLGDSIVKGVFLDQAETFPAQLERLVKPLKFVNAGIRFSSPLRQSQILQELTTRYKISGLVWVINAGDATDELFYDSIASQRDRDGIPSKFEYQFRYTSNKGAPFLIALLKLVGSRLISVESILFHFYFKDYQSHIKTEPTRSALCSGLWRGLAFAAAAQIPTLVVFTPHPEEGLRHNWGGLAVDYRSFAVVKECARRKLAENVIDLSEETLSLEHYQSDRMHLSEKGSRWLATQVQSKALRFFEKLKK